MSVIQETELLPPPRRTFYQKYERAIIGGVSVILVLAAWEAFWSAGKISPLFFTGPSQVLTRFTEEWNDGRLKQDMVYSGTNFVRSEEHTSELQSRLHLVCRLLLEKKKKK